MTKRKPVRGQLVQDGYPLFKESIVVRRLPHTIYALQPAGTDDLVRGTPLLRKTPHGTIRMWRKKKR
jgi:hypothetical protein